MIMYELTTDESVNLSRVKTACMSVLMTIDTWKLQTKSYNDVVLSGSYPAMIYHNETHHAKDIDIFILNCANNYRFPDSIKSADGATLGSFNPNPPYVKRPVEIVDTIVSNMSYMGKPINLIATTYTNRHDLVDHFDMAQCQMHYAWSELGGHKLFFTPFVLNCIKNKWIASSKKFKTEIKPYRVEKYLSYGWTVAPAGI